MTPQERQLVDDLFDRLSKVESAPRDPDAAAAIAQGLRQAPNAVYALVQTVLLQDEALKRAHSRIQELEARRAEQQPVRRLPRFDARHHLRASAAARLGAERPAARASQPPDLEQRPGDAAGAGPGTIWPGAVRSAALWRANRPPMGGGGGSFLGTAAAAAAGVVGGSLLLGSIRSMMGGAATSRASAIPRAR